MKRTVYTKRSKWLVRCDCGTEKEVFGEALARGATTSCGCRRSELVSAKNTTHGCSRTALYRVWNTMLDRCLNPTSKAYGNYGARGVNVCERWRDFVNFRDDMGDRPSPKHSLERKDNDGNYEPCNVVWATQKEQSRNTRRNIRVSYGGRRQVLKDWAAELNINYFTLIDRLLVQNLGVEEAFTRPVGRWKLTHMESKNEKIRSR